MRAPSRYLGDDAESLFRSRPIAEIRTVEASTRKEIENKQEDLRQLVGRSYRDLIQSADSILLMKASSESISANLGSIDAAIRSLSAADHGISKSTGPNAPQVSSKDRSKKLYGIGCRIKYLVDTPENIWGFLDESMFLDAAGRYLRARKVHGLLVGNPSAKEFLPNFPLLQHQFQLVENFKVQISQRSREKLVDRSGCIRKDAGFFADALSAIAIVDELSPDLILSLFLESRRTWVSQSLHTKSTDDLLDIAVSRVFCEVVGIIQVTVAQVGELFLCASNDLPLFYRKVLSAPPGSQLFGGIPDPDEEAKAWKQHWEKLESVMGMLESKFVSQSCLSWVSLVSEDLNSALSSDGLQLVKVFRSGYHLATTEKDVNEKLDGKEVLEGSLDWLRSYYVLVIESPWERICELVLGQPKKLWDELFEQMFVSRMKEIIEFAFEDLSRNIKVKDVLGAVVGNEDSLDKYSAGSLWFAVRTTNMRLGASNIKTLDDETDFHACLDAYFGPEVSRIRDTVDKRCKGILEDLLCFIEVQKSSSRLKELGPFIQEKCYNGLSAIVRELEGEIRQLSIVLNEKYAKFGDGVNDREDLCVIVEKSLLIGRLVFALRNHSTFLPLILGSPREWVAQGKGRSCVQGFSNARPSRVRIEHSILESPGKQSFSPHAGISAFGVDENFNRGLEELTKTLRDLCVKAHRLWILWVSNELSVALARDLEKDEALSATSALKGWEESLIKQDQPKESTGVPMEELKIALPSMPSLYVTGFLFQACQEIHRVGGHVVDKVILHDFSKTLHERAVKTYEKFLSNIDTHTLPVSEKGILQILFDLKFISDVLSGGSEASLRNATGKEREVTTRIPYLRKHSSIQPVDSGNPVQVLIHAFSQRLDPIDWAIYEAHLWANEKQWYQRNAVLFGFLMQLNRMYTDSVQKSYANSESNVLRSAVVPRFKYLPISAPVSSSRGSSTPTRTPSSDELSSRNLWRTYSNGEHSPKLDFDDSSSYVAATPLLKSFMTQVDSKFGESTLKLGSMLSDGQVGRLKDKSAAAMSTFGLGDMLPMQAAGLLSSLTTGASRSDS